MQETFVLSPVGLVGDEECHKKLAVQVQFYKVNFFFLTLKSPPTF